jgi:hypothetical protein
VLRLDAAQNLLQAIRSPPGDHHLGAQTRQSGSSDKADAGGGASDQANFAEQGWIDFHYLRHAHNYLTIAKNPTRILLRTLDKV